MYVPSCIPNICPMWSVTTAMNYCRSYHIIPFRILHGPTLQRKLHIFIVPRLGSLSACALQNNEKIGIGSMRFDCIEKY